MFNTFFLEAESVHWEALRSTITVANPKETHKLFSINVTVSGMLQPPDACVNVKQRKLAVRFRRTTTLGERTTLHGSSDHDITRQRRLRAINT